MLAACSLPAAVNRTMRALRSLGWASSVTMPRESSRSTAVVIAPLVSSTRRPISLTGCGPLWRSISMTAKSERPTSADSMLRVARRWSVRCAFISTNHRCVPEPSAVCFFGTLRFIRKYLNIKILYVKQSVNRLAVGRWQLTEAETRPTGNSQQPTDESETVHNARMKAIQLDAPGPPDALHVRDLPLPQPPDGWVRI